jgi:hypothetical protein
LGTYVVRERRLPDGFTVYAIPGAQLDRQLDAYLVTLDSATPNAQFIVFHVSGEYAGSVSARIFACPPTMRRDNLVGEACQPATDVAVTLLLPDGSQRGLDTAVVKGNTVTWSDLPPGEFEIAQGELAPPYADSYAPEATASALNPRAYRITLSEETPNAVVTIYNLQSTSGQALDSDGDGLNDAAEPGIGTDPLDPDTDGDGRADGDEIGPRRVNTDPLDADSDDDGVADGDELANGTDPNDPISR